MEQPKISIIVPIYKVEPWLRKCLDSIANQTYRNLEIILVDDGSPDNCPAICDEYVANDPRFKVIHKPNGGVASARNAGLDAATGDWIGWVDADDWAEPDMFEYLLKNALREGADIVTCGYYVAAQDQILYQSPVRPGLYDKEAALRIHFADDGIYRVLWDKLIRRELWEGVRMPNRAVAEDTAALYVLLNRAEKILCLPESKYYYRRRLGSVSHSGLNSSLDDYAVIRQRYEEGRTQWPQFEQLLRDECLRSAGNVWCDYCKAPRRDRRAVLPQIREISDFCRPNISAALADSNGLGLAGKLKIWAVGYPHLWAFALVWAVDTLYQWKHWAN